jgi:peptide deformylase
MALLTILKFPDPRLRLVAKPVTRFDQTLQQIIANMFETMVQSKGVGLAAIQVNILQQIIVMDIEGKNQPLTLVNPEIVEKTDTSASEEGCLSFPGVFATVQRAKTIKVRFQDVLGEFQERQCEGLESHCIQHEIDHLNGITFVDHLSALKRNRILKKLQKLQRSTF